MDSVISRDGTRIAYEARGAGAPLVMVHGIASDHARFEPVLGALAERFTVYAMDRRGRAASGDTAPYALERELEDVAAVVDAAARASDAPVTLFGHSFGGLCALGATLLTRDVARLLVYEPYVPPEPARAPSAIVRRYEELASSGDDEALLTTFLREILRFGDAQIRMLRETPAWRGHVSAAPRIPREMRAVEAYRFEPARFEALRIPIGMMLGTESPAFLAECTARLHRVFPTSEVISLAGQGHAAVNGAPRLFVSTVIDFAARLA